MKSKAIKLAALCLALTLVFSCMLSVSATVYTVDVLAEDFAAADCEFLAPGDLDADGTLNAKDAVSLRKLLIEDETDGTYIAVYTDKGEEAKYSDVNGDDAVNILDLVRQKKNIANNFTLVNTKEGTMALNGNTAYKGEFVSKMGTGAEYKVAFSYKSDSDIKIKINIGEEPIVIEKAATNDLTTVEEVIKTPFEFAENGIEFQIIGQGEVSEVSVTRTNMDNEYSENW